MEGLGGDGVWSRGMMASGGGEWAALARPATCGVSVVVTAYDRPEGLERTLASLAEQERQPDEVIVVDDASPRDMTSVVERWAGRFRGFVFHRQPENLGMPGNLNWGVARAGGELIVNLHDGDTFSSDLLAAWERLMVAHAEAVLVFSRTTATDGRHLRRLARTAEVTSGEEFYRRFFLNAWRGRSVIWGTVMVRRRAYAGGGLFRAEYGPLADVDRWMALCREGAIGYAAAPVIEVRATPSHYQRGVRWDLVRALERMHREHRRIFLAGSAWPRRVASGLAHLLVFGALYALMFQARVRRGRA